jgi:phosphoglycolate phosphatase
MTKLPIRGVLFDKDGTLLDFDATWPPAYRAVAEELASLAGDPGLAARILRLGGYGEGGALDPASVFACGTTREIVEFCVGLPELRGIAGIAERADGIFTRFGERGPSAVDDLAGLLEGLRRRGLRLGLATNDSIASTRAWLAYHDFEELFYFVSGFDSGYGPKPDPAVLDAFCAASGLAPGAVCMVGDAVTDAELARAAGAGLSVIVRSGVDVGDALAAMADVVISTVVELGPVIERYDRGL